MESTTNELVDIVQEVSEQIDDHKVVLLPVQNRHSSSTPYPLTQERVASLLQSAGYKGEIIETEFRCYVESGAEGWKFRVYFFDDNSTKSGEQKNSIMFNSGWGITAEKVPDLLKAANVFNAKFRYLKAYVVTEEEYSYTESEMSVFGGDGLSDDAFIAALEMFLNLRQSYVSICREMLS